MGFTLQSSHLPPLSTQSAIVEHGEIEQARSYDCAWQIDLCAARHGAERGFRAADWVSLRRRAVQSGQMHKLKVDLIAGTGELDRSARAQVTDRLRPLLFVDFDAVASRTDHPQSAASRRF
jgi:hypothetical protein